MVMKRRDFVRTMCYGGIATFGLPVVNFAQVPQRGRFVFVLLRGGFDGLAAVVPYGDPDSLLNRGELARTIATATARRGLDPRSLTDVVDVPAGNPLHGMLADTSIAAADRIALAIAGPSFQWR